MLKSLAVRILFDKWFLSEMIRTDQIPDSEKNKIDAEGVIHVDFTK